MTNPERGPDEESEEFNLNKTDEHPVAPPEAEPTDSAEVFKQGREAAERSPYFQGLMEQLRDLNKQKEKLFKQLMRTHKNAKRAEILIKIERGEEEKKDIEEKIHAWQDEVKKKAADTVKKNEGKDEK